MKKQDRYSDSFASKEVEIPTADFLFLMASSDWGVRGNRGRPGSRYAPAAILQVFSKMSHYNTQFHYSKLEVTGPNGSFEQEQDQEFSNILNLREKFKGSLIHLGGGHDHAYPFVKALCHNSADELIIFNIDAHLDTRIDSQNHSGTPFRNIDSLKLKGELIQYGIQDFANSQSTFSPLDHLKHQIFQKGDTNFWTLLADKKLEGKKVFLSIDADAIHSSQMEAVSAVNYDGINLEEILRLIQELKAKKAQLHMGVYEYNPLYDNLSQKGARSLARLIHEFVK